MSLCPRPWQCPVSHEPQRSVFRVQQELSYRAEFTVQLHRFRYNRCWLLLVKKYCIKKCISIDTVSSDQINVLFLWSPGDLVQDTDTSFYREAENYPQIKTIHLYFTLHVEFPRNGKRWNILFDAENIIKSETKWINKYLNGMQWNVKSQTVGLGRTESKQKLNEIATKFILFWQHERNNDNFYFVIVSVGRWNPVPDVWTLIIHIKNLHNYF